MSDRIFSFGGQPVTAHPGQSLAAALTEGGLLEMRRTAGGHARGIFCGMGVCQECLVTVNGRKNVRACMTEATAGLIVERQRARPVAASPGSGKVGAAVEIAPDVLVVGAGVGGLSAAIEARRSGASVVVVDERSRAGGQYYKQSTDGTELDAQQAEGAALVAAAEAAGAEILCDAEIWGAFDGLLFAGRHGTRALVIRPKAAIIATGAFERPVMVPGWTLPGVMTTGAAQTLWRSHRTLPGRRVALCGSGPLNLQVALELARGGAEIVLVAESASSPLTRPLAALSMMLADPMLGSTGVRLYRALRARGIPVRNRLQLASVRQEGNALACRFRQASGRETDVTVDALCMNGGFEPQNEILRLLGAEMRYDPVMGHLRCVRSDRMETSVPGLYAVGDCAKLGGAPAARVEGRIAGRAAATGHVVSPDDAADLKSLRRHRRFQARLWALHDIAPHESDRLTDDTMICRCEEITAGVMRDGLGQSPSHIGTLKRWTRIGMGRCQGRFCAPVAARMLSECTERPVEDFSFFAPRVPIRPVSLSCIVAVDAALMSATDAAEPRELPS
jgi:NADPH-dependent 2,4-dienoyl-CoA reductase/sulfur reductase-like enzyme